MKTIQIHLAILLCALCTQLPLAVSAAKIPVILDTDIGDDIDDTWALTLALKSPELDLKLVVGDYGKPLYRAKLIAKLLETAKRTDVAVGLGIEVEAGQKMRQEKWIEGYNLDRYPGKVHRDGVQAMIDLIMQSPEPVTLLCIGPVPNIAEALKREPKIAGRARFVGMHGSVRVGYNGATKPSAEWNVRADAKACQAAFTAPWNMTITPLDTCGLVQLKGDKYAAVRDCPDSMVKALIENYRIWDQWNQANNQKARNADTASSVLFDCVAVYLAMANDFCVMEQVPLRVDDQGYTREEPNGKLVNAAMAWRDLPGFENWLVKRLIGPGILPHQAAAAAKPWNILFCFADDWGRYAKCYAVAGPRPSINPLLKTPVIDRMAREGVLFKNAFVTAPSCTPCRSSLLSGQYFFRTGRGAILQGAQWDASIPSYPLLLRDAGYHIGKSYKVWSPGSPVDAPYGGQQHAYEKAGRDFCDFSENASKLVREGMSFAAAKEKILAQVRDNFDAFLADRKPGQPFCFWFGPTLTHRKWEKGSGEALWGIEPDLVMGRLPKFMPDVPEVRADFTDYMGEIQAWDAGIGVLIKKLEDIGELDNTLVVLSGDHGMPGVPGGKCNLYDFGVGVALIARVPGGKGGRVVDDFVNLMDLAPTFLETGGIKPPGVMTGRSLLNVLRSRESGLVDPARTWVLTGRERHVADAREGSLPYPHRALRTADFLYVRNFAPDRWPMGSPNFSGGGDEPSLEAVEQNTFACFSDMDASPTKAWLVGQRKKEQWQWHYDYAFGKRPGEQLFDLRYDPDQTVNVAADPKYAKTRADMEQRLMDELNRTGDPRLVEGGKFFETPPMSGPLTETAAPATKKRGKRK